MTLSMDASARKFRPFGLNDGYEKIWIESGRFFHTLWHENSKGTRTVICRTAYGDWLHAKAEILQGVLDRGGRVDDLMDMVLVSSWPPGPLTFLFGLVTGILFMMWVHGGAV